MVSSVVKSDLSINIGKLKLKNPLITASGTYGYADEYEDYINFENLGAIITKGITLNPRAGNFHPRIGEVKNGMINSIGLENIGINKFIETKLPVLKNKNIDFIVNIAGFSLNEYVELAKICQSNEINAIELNVSCPNVTGGCLEFAKDKDLLNQVISSVREVYEGTLIVKLSPNVSNPTEIALTVQNAGADAISAINTVKAMQMKSTIQNGKIVSSFVKGGMSGPVVKPIALAFIHEIKQAINIPIIGLGGISNIKDILDFIAVGACAFQVGTANFTHPNIVDTLAQDLNNLLVENKIADFKSLIKGE